MLWDWLGPILTLIGSVFASGGLWTYITWKAKKNDAGTKMILGLGHDRLIHLCTKYIDRGFISSDELENLHQYLYTPYKGLGGNGTVTRLIAHIDNLPIKNGNKTVDFD